MVDVPEHVPPRARRICVVMPAYNAEHTLERTHRDLPLDWVDDIVLVDDASRDRTVEVARGLGIHTLVHPRNRGYGGNQKTCYREALARGADIVVMVHPDHQYDPRYIPQLVEPLLAGGCDAVFGSRMLGGRPLEGGAYSRRYLEAVALEENSDDFVFDTEIIAQGVWKGMRIREIPIATRYFDEASQIGFWRSVRYGFAILHVLLRYKLHKKGVLRSRLFV
jgi:glycosyltransferase involved in cell wall biosynthesis